MANFSLKKRPPSARVLYDRHRKAVARAQEKVMRAAAANRAGVTEDWDHRYVFVGEVALLPRIIRATVTVSGEPAESARVTVWTLLSKGTDVRKVGLSSDYKRATTPGQFFSRKKQGTIFVDGEAREGIEARRWDEIQNEETLVELGDKSRAAVRGLRRV